MQRTFSCPGVKQPMAFPPRFLDELKTRISLADVVSKRVKLIKKGHEHQGLCPFHNEKTPSFTLNEEKGFYHCFGCQANGSAIDFVMETEGLGFKDAVEQLAGIAGMEVPQDSPEARAREQKRQTLVDVVEAAAKYFEKMLRMPEGRAAMDYVRGRGLSSATAETFRLGFAPNSRSNLKTALLREGIPEDLMIAAGLLIKPDRDNGRGTDSYDRFRGRLMFPIQDRRSRVIAFGGRILGDGEPKYLNSPETPLFHKGRELYALNHAMRAARKSGTMVVSEGYMDVIALYQAGFEHAVAPLGTALTEEQLQLIWKSVPEPVLCFDGDRAGMAAAKKASLKALPHLRPGYGLRISSLPDKEDPDSLIKSGGKAAMQAVLDQAVPLSEFLWRSETGGRLPTTPEDKAALQARLKDHTRDIQDPDIRKLFAKAFNDRIWPDNKGSSSQGYNRSRGRDNRRGWSSDMYFEADAGPNARVNIRQMREIILLGTVINHPELYDHVSERLGTIAFQAPDLDNLRQQVLKTLAAQSGLETEALIAHLKQQGDYHDVLSKVLGADVYDHAFFARADVDPEIAQAGWTETFEKLRGKDLNAEIEDAERDFASNPTEGAWKRLATLKQQKIDNIGDELAD
jgi:DNA primase